MSYSPGSVLKKPGRPPLKATHFYHQTRTEDGHIQLPCPPTKAKTSRQRKHPFGRVSPPTSRFNKLNGIHRTGSLGSLDRSLKCFASPHLYPPSPILPHSHLRSSQKVSQTDSDYSCELRATESAGRLKRPRPVRSTSLDSADSSRLITTTQANNYFPDSITRRFSMEGVDQEIALALNGLTIANPPGVCPDGHIAPPPSALREVQSAGATSSPRCKLDLSPAAATLARESSGSACSSSPDSRSQTLLKGRVSSPRCLFKGEPPLSAINVEMRVASISGVQIQPPDPRKVGVVLTGGGNSGFLPAASAFKPIHQIQDGKPTTLST